MNIDKMNVYIPKMRYLMVLLFCFGPNVAVGRWNLLWHDEFSSKRIDRKKWSFMIGDGCDLGICGWGNNEHQFYTNSENNAYVESGRLILKARKETGEDLRALSRLCSKHCRSNDACKAKCDNLSGISSARIRSLGKFSVFPGYKGYDAIKISLKFKVSAADGIWAAAWMLPDTSNSSCSGCGKYGPWSASGEIDIFEGVNTMREALGTLHYGGSWPDNLSWGGKTAMNPRKWNTMSLIWRKDSMEWYFNQKLMHRASSGRGTRNGWFSTSNKSSTYSPFDTPFHILLNLAVGGHLTGNVDLQQAQRTLENGSKTMHIDYVRVYGSKDFQRP